MGTSQNKEILSFREGKLKGDFTPAIVGVCSECDDSVLILCDKYGNIYLDHVDKESWCRKISIKDIYF